MKETKKRDAIITGLLAAGIIIGVMWVLVHSHTASRPTTTTLEIETTPTPFISRTLQPTRTPSATVTPTAPLTSIPAFDQTNIGTNFLFGGETDDCRLPCWHGLRVGESTMNDVQAVVDTVFGMQGISAGHFISAPGVLRFVWSTEDLRNHINIRMIFDRDWRMLEGIKFSGNGEYIQYLTLSEILNQKGLPTASYFRVQGTAHSHYLEPRILLIYDDGLIVDLGYMRNYCKLDIACTYYVTHIDFCSYMEPSTATITIREPIQSVSTISGELDDDYRLFEDFFKIDLSTLLAQNLTGNFCLPIDFPEHDD